MVGTQGNGSHSRRLAAHWARVREQPGRAWAFVVWMRLGAPPGRCHTPPSRFRGEGGSPTSVEGQVTRRVLRH